jgi:hypothetical protein
MLAWLAAGLCVVADADAVGNGLRTEVSVMTPDTAPMRAGVGIATLAVHDSPAQFEAGRCKGRPD